MDSLPVARVGECIILFMFRLPCAVSYFLFYLFSCLHVFSYPLNNPLHENLHLIIVAGVGGGQGVLLFEGDPPVFQQLGVVGMETLS